MCDVAVTYEIGRPKDNRRRDLANLEKALSDLLADQKILLDDSSIVDLRMRWVERDGVRILIEAVP